jgi:hypothetical protein
LVKAIYTEKTTVNRNRKFWFAAVAILAIVGVLFVLITPAPDELPSTGPHSLDKSLAFALAHFGPLLHPEWNAIPFLLSSVRAVVRSNPLSFTCVLLC